MMDFRRMMDEAIARLQARGLEVEFEVEPAPSADALETAAERLGHPLPAELVAFLQQVGDGVWLLWEDEATGEEGRLSLHSLGEMVSLARMHQGGSEPGYTYPYVDDPELARRTEERMKQWLPIYDEGSGGGPVLDLAEDPPTVLEHRVAWMDGGTGDNGVFIAASFTEFMLRGAAVCFEGCWESAPTDSGD